MTVAASSNGVIRIGRKGLKKFAIGEEDDPRKLPVFEIDVVDAFQQWSLIVESFRSAEPNESGEYVIEPGRTMEYNQAAVDFVEHLGGGNDITKGEAFDFLARLREQYNELADFFRPKLREERGSLGTSEAQSRVQFSVEGDN